MIPSQVAVSQKCELISLQYETYLLSFVPRRKIYNSALLGTNSIFFAVTLLNHQCGLFC